uniref:Protein PHLOEM PROTEIN 2-LIKE A1-like n=1 Tax=Rhizophora mucronata TaxID=61149 RepID=A0A2P2P3I6_RHIMU
MGTEWSQDGASQSQPQPSDEEPMHRKSPGTVTVEEKATEAGVSDTKSKTLGKKAAAQFKSQEKKGKETRATDDSTQHRDTKSIIKAAQVKLPHKCEAILRGGDANPPICWSPIDKLYDQLYRGVFLNQNRKKYWVEKESSSNCFMLFARDLSITWADDTDYWRWISLNVDDTSDVLVEVAQLLNVCWLEIHAQFDISNLSPFVLYQVALVVMLADKTYGWEAPVNVRLTLPNGTKQEHKESLLAKPKGQWIEIPVGELQTSRDNVGDVDIYAHEYEVGNWKRGLIIKGIVIRPKKRS